MLLGSGELFVESLELSRAIEDAGEIRGCPDKLLKRRPQEGAGACGSKSCQQHSMAVAVFVGPQSFAQAGEGRPRRPLVSIDATSSPERKCCDRPDVRQVRIAAKGGIFHNQETIDERAEGRAQNLLDILHAAALVHTPPVPVIVVREAI